MSQAPASDTSCLCASLCIRSGAILAGLAVIAGAFGAHVLKDSLTAHDLDIFEKGVRYQMYHALGLHLCGALAPRIKRPRLVLHSLLWGTVIFSGSLYLLVLTGVRKFGMITPIGGTLMIVGWMSLALGMRRASPNA